MLLVNKLVQAIVENKICAKFEENREKTVAPELRHILYKIQFGKNVQNVFLGPESVLTNGPGSALNLTITAI